MVVDANSINKILTKHDPKGLIDFGAPEGEYGSEAEYIARHITGDESEVSIYRFIKSHFKDRFNGITIYERWKLRKVARDIHRAML